MATEQNSLKEQIIAKSVKDEVFRQHLLSNPKQTLERELGVALPPEVTVQVHEDTATIFHLVLPMKMQELTDEELEQVVGGSAPPSGSLNTSGGELNIYPPSGGTVNVFINED